MLCRRAPPAEASGYLAQPGTGILAARLCAGSLLMSLESLSSQLSQLGCRPELVFF